MSEKPKFALAIMEKKEYSSALIVTFLYHTRRARHLFEQYFNCKEINLTICSFEQVSSNKLWWKDDLKPDLLQTNT